jgi:FkbM family methyltransferase
MNSALIEALKKTRKMAGKIVFLHENFFDFILRTLYFSFRIIPRGKQITTRSLTSFWNTETEVSVNGFSLVFITPNWLTNYRAKTIKTKEPETIGWINSFGKDTIFWDIGANVGVFSIYAGLAKKVKVIAVEPSFMNLDLLFRNIQRNKIQELITIVPLALSRSSKEQDFFMSKMGMDWGGAHNSSGKNILQDGSEMIRAITSKQLSVSLDDLCEKFDLAKPTHMKVDVDGLESEVLAGATAMLGQVREILIEVDLRNTSELKIVSDTLSNFGFSRIHNDFGFEFTENQLWRKQ